MTLCIGLMSGTSMDGIDAALVDVDQHRLIAGMTKPYSSTAREQLHQVMHQDARISPAALIQLHTLLGREFADAALAVLQMTDISRDAVTAIGSHGQTICHDAFATIPYTLQLACPHTIAERTGMTVIADFRTRDLVLGGQGAPFAPLYHRELFAHIAPSTAVVNLGGIANLTVFKEDETVMGFDIGPGNCLMDAWIAKHQNMRFDHQGAWASSGQIIEPLLQSLLSDVYFQQLPPKSIGKEYFSLAWLATHIGSQHYAAADVQSTLLALTATLIARATQSHANHTKRVLLCGGGAHNQALTNQLQTMLTTHHVASTATVGIDPDYLEAMMFAWLACQTLARRPFDLHAITGATKPAVLGVIYPGLF